ncbi:hypothetical protein ABC383_17680 [Noviherbaspirillum sp. 1P10PC]|uniref:hypothetical protein n=1 Tax=Noviherbaspirillum sp. 1P10PC TaxID=3132292 RepID=UPI0039A0634E
MRQRFIIMPSGNAVSTFVIHRVQWFECKGVVCLDARGKPLEWIPVLDIEKGRRVRDMLIGAVDGDRRYRTLDWSFLQDASDPVAP